MEFRIDFLILSALVATSMVSVRAEIAGDVESFEDVPTGRTDFPCPESADIFPCICTVDEVNYYLHMDCSLVRYYEEYVRAFQQEFPNKKFESFYMEYTYVQIDKLENSFNGVTFEEVSYIRENISSVSQYFLYDSEATVRYIAMTYTGLTTENFPFTSLAVFTSLKTLILSYANFDWIPKIISSSLTTLVLEGSNISDLPADTFASARNLLYINLGANNIHTLYADTFLIHNLNTTIWLHQNDLDTIEPGAFVPLDGYYNGNPFYLHLQLNNLTIIDQEVFEEIFENAQISLTMFGNPLTCGCDLAWIVTNNVYRSRIDNLTTCADGTNIHDLDQELYVNC